MPHVRRRHGKKTKQPKRTKPLDIRDPEALALHRELSVLRIAGRCKPGAHRDELMERRMAKLESSRPKAALAAVPNMEAQIIALREYYERKRT